ncbi:hypothetical protein [Herbidospora sp. NBRC 101105]|nr:hypothetical protein [Herbidospora sp. NBRC 101105]
MRRQKPLLRYGSAHPGTARRPDDGHHPALLGRSPTHRDAG